jgi:hypothetical protein
VPASGYNPAEKQPQKINNKSALKAEAMQKEKQKQLTQDYADFLIDYEAAKAQGTALGTFLAWRHLNNRDGIEIDDSRKK